MHVQRFKLAAIGLAVAIALGACGASDADDASDLPSLTTLSGDSADGAEASSDEDGGELTEADRDRAIAEYESCLADAGVDVGNLSGGGDGAMVESFEIEAGEDGEPADLESIEGAAEACNEILDDAFGSFELSPEEEAEAADQMLEMQRCLSEQGFEIDMGDGAFELDENIDFEAFEEAMGACGNDVETGSDQ